MANEKVYSVIDGLIEINEDFQEKIDRLKYFERKADIKHRDLDSTLKELDSRVNGMLDLSAVGKPKRKSNRAIV